MLVVAATGARLALVSTGDGNRFRHPRADIRARWRRQGADWLDTARAGALRVRLGPDGQPSWTVERVRRARIWDAEARRQRLRDAPER